MIVAIIGILLLTTAIYAITTNWEKIFGKEDKNNVLLLEDLRNEVNEELKSFKMKKILKYRDLVLRKENFTQISNYQKYVTPNDPTVKVYIASNGITTIKQAYTTAVDWIWVSDQTLHGKPELWLLPAQFIQDAPTNPNNPQPGNMVSDCEPQAYTLVSAIESTGMLKENVRVVVGEVNFSGEIGGHAWVRIYQDGQWIELEVTSRSFWDDDDQKLVENTGFPFNYFKSRPYPVVEYWAFFNDKYYYNPHNGKQSPDLPPHWFAES